MIKLFSKFIKTQKELLNFFLALPVIIIIRFISPFIIIRLNVVDFGRIGGMYKAEWYLSQKKQKIHDKNYLDILDIIVGRFTLKTCNTQWYKMWKKHVYVGVFSKLLLEVYKLNRHFWNFSKHIIPLQVHTHKLRKDIKKKLITESAVNCDLNLKSVLKNQYPNIFFDKDEWIWIYNHFGYTGDYEFIYFE